MEFNIRRLTYDELQSYFDAQDKFGKGEEGLRQKQELLVRGCVETDAGKPLFGKADAFVTYLQPAEFIKLVVECQRIQGIGADQESETVKNSNGGPASK